MSEIITEINIKGTPRDRSFTHVFDNTLADTCVLCIAVNTPVKDGSIHFHLYGGHEVHDPHSHTFVYDRCSFDDGLTERLFHLRGPNNPFTDSDTCNAFTLSIDHIQIPDNVTLTIRITQY